MSRFLARALAAMEVGPIAEAPPAVSRPAAAAGFGGYGGFGERTENGKALARMAPAQGFGGYGGFGDAAENENQTGQQFPWPEGVDFHLTRDAARVSGLISGGCDWRWCPDGGLEIVSDKGLLWALSPIYSRRLQGAQLLPPDVLEAAP